MAAAKQTYKQQRKRT